MHSPRFNVHNMTLGLLNVPTTNIDFHKEVSNVNNRYSATLLIKWLWRNTKMQWEDPIQESIASMYKYFRLNYLEERTYRMASKLRKFRIKATSMNNNNLGTNLGNVKEKSDMNTRSGACHISCYNCEAYCGQNVGNVRIRTRKRAQAIAREHKEVDLEMLTRSCNVNKHILLVENIHLRHPSKERWHIGSIRTVRN